MSIVDLYTKIAQNEYFSPLFTMANQVYSMLKLYSHFIRDSKSGKRRQKNGAKLKNGTIENYKATFNHLVAYSQRQTQELQIRHMSKLGKSEHNKERKYWEKFHFGFGAYLGSQGLTDNYIGFHFKNIKAFFHYLQQYKSIDPGVYFKTLIVRKEESPIIVLSQERLTYLVHNQEFKNKLAPNQKAVLDIFLFGCTTSLRYSDLSLLKAQNLTRENNGTYLIVRSLKTETSTRIKLPKIALEIIDSYRRKQQTLLPQISLNQFNQTLKLIFERAEWTEVIGKQRKVNGVIKTMKTQSGKNFRFCDLASSHMMRKTGITSMLLFGMPEPLVRKISGHAAGSKEFYRYVKYSQTYLDEHTDAVFNKMLQEPDSIITD